MEEGQNAYYRQLLQDRPTIAEDMCVTWSQGASLEEVARGFGANLATAEPRTLDEVAEEAALDGWERSGGVVLLLGRLHDWVVALEPSGWQGARSAVLRQVSAKGRSICVHCGPLSHHSLWFALEGKPLVRIPWLDNREGPQPHFLQAQEVGLRLSEQTDANDWKASAYSLAERVTDTRMSVDWLRQTHTRYLIPQTLPDELIPWGYEDHPVAREAAIAEILTDPAGHWREIAVLAAKTAIEATEVKGNAITMGLRNLNSGIFDDADVLEGLRNLKESLTREYSEQVANIGPGGLRKLNLRLSAIDTLVSALDRDANRAAKNAAAAARKIWLNEETMVRLQILYRCALHPA
ncbi:DUF6461 domain-containing protein [Streptosporangium subroseum]|uniref:DUF6461 domain-containing protein n=1 Tax=Streptosporangium subroseum TaxID=106412 RepID=UPI00308D9751|nr:DUF6461 domain-containing protein [Streptosporangium subroseum]